LAGVEFVFADGGFAGGGGESEEDEGREGEGQEVHVLVVGWGFRNWLLWDEWRWVVVRVLRRADEEAFCKYGKRFNLRDRVRDSSYLEGA